jgi:hypothetical protein
MKLEDTPEGSRSGKPSTAGSQDIVVTRGAGCELDTVLALESCYLALLLKRPPAEIERIKIVLGRFAHGVGASGVGTPSDAQRTLGKFHNTTINPARSLQKATAVRRRQVRAVFVTFLGDDAEPSPDVTRIEKPLRAALRSAALLAFRLGGEPVHAPCPEPKAAAVLIVAWAEAATTAASIMKDELFTPYLEERVAQAAPPREMRITLLALQAAEMHGEMKQGLHQQIMDLLRPMVRNDAGAGSPVSAFAACAAACFTGTFAAYRAAGALHPSMAPNPPALTRSATPTAAAKAVGPASGCTARLPPANDNAGQLVRGNVVTLTARPAARSDAGDRGPDSVDAALPAACHGAGAQGLDSDDADNGPVGC